jgi:GTP cyclohydrolase I
MFNKEKMKQATEVFLEAIGNDYKNDPNTRETPERVAKMYEILLGGYEIDPKTYLKTFPAKSDDMVTLTNIPFYSFCSHHLLPFIGKLHIAYIPDGKVVGISKLVRFSRIFAKRLNLQEDLTQNISDILEKELNAQGVMVKMEATHFCMTLRGVRAPSAVMVTTARRGLFRTDPSLQNEFNLAIKNQGVFSY